MCMMKEGIALSVDRTKQKRILLIINPNAGVIKKDFPFPHGILPIEYIQTFGGICI